MPSSPLKKGEKRAKRWRETHGHDQTEIDALVELHPDVLRDATLEAIRPFYDSDLDERVRETEVEWQKKADGALHAHPDYEDACDRIRDAWERVQVAANELHVEQKRATEILRGRLPPPPELPEAQPDGEATPALFDTDTDFVTATRRLINRKKLIPEEDADDDNDEFLTNPLDGVDC